MIDRQTVFILGAGASCPYGFPTARGLRSDIITNFPGRYEKLLIDREELSGYRANIGHPGLKDADDFVTRFDRSSTESVDLFLSRNPSFAKIGKMAISTSILFAEQNSHFRERVKNPSHDWYFRLFSTLSRDLIHENGLQEFGKNRAAIVTFNYDRSLEHFLYESVWNSFEGANAATAAEHVRRLPIIHAYGTLAPLDWQDTDGQNTLEYGGYAALPHLDLPAVSDNLHIVHEKRENPNIEKARETVSNADRIFVFGFGYAKENLEALGLPGVLMSEHRIYGTAMGWTPKEILDIESYFARGLRQAGCKVAARDQVKIRNCDCVALLREFL